MNERGRKKARNLMQFGFPSILLAFSMICIITFSALSFLTVYSDYKLSQKTAENSKRYYQVEAKAYQKLAKVDKALSDAYQSAESKADYFSKLTEVLAECGGTYCTGESSHFFSFSQNLSENQKLEIVLWLRYPEKSNETFYEIKSWKVMISGDIGQSDTYQLADPNINDERIDE